MNKPVKIVIVGLRFGRGIALELNRAPASQWLEVVGVCDLDAAKRTALAEQMAVAAHSDLDEVLARPDVEAIGLFTGPAGRAELLRKIIRSGKDVITTKPFETDPRAALDVLQEAQRMGRVIHLNSPAPTLTPDLAQIQRWREEFSLGRPVAARADTWCSYREVPDGSWYDDPQRCPVAPILRLGIYMINDLVQIFGPAEFVHVLQSSLFTKRPTPDNAQMSIVFSNGVLACIFASFCVHDGDKYRNGLTLNFENGTIYRNSGPLQHKPESGCELALVALRDGHRSVVAQAASEQWSGSYQWEAFSRAVRGEPIAAVTTPRQIADGLRIVHAMAASQESGLPVRVE